MKYSSAILLLLLAAALAAQAQTLSPEARKVQAFMPPHAVIAHRGTIYWAPELTESAFRWARNAGADYLELDVRRSKDGVLVIMHDKTFRRTTDVAVQFPGRENDKVEDFDYGEIRKLDAGSAFNAKNPGQARKSFGGADVLVFEDVFRIAMGMRIRRNPDGSRVCTPQAGGGYLFAYEPDPADNGHRPGVYIELKDPESYPGIEEQVYRELAAMGWNPCEEEQPGKGGPFYRKGRVNAGNTPGKILLQSFSIQGMQNVKRVFGEKVLASYLIGNPGTGDLSREEAMDRVIARALDAGVQFIGTNLGDENDGLPPAFAQKIHAAGLKANVYSFNTTAQMEKYFGPGKGKRSNPLADGMITNRTDLTHEFYTQRKVRKVKNPGSPVAILARLGY